MKNLFLCFLMMFLTSCSYWHPGSHFDKRDKKAMFVIEVIKNEENCYCLVNTPGSPHWIICPLNSNVGDTLIISIK